MKTALTFLCLLFLSGCETITREQWESSLKAVLGAALDEAQHLNEQGGSK